MIIKCVFAATNAAGSPDFGFVKVECTEAQYELGEHYEAAKDWAENNDYEAPFVVFDEHEAQDWLLERFVWDSASVHSLQGQLSEQARQKATVYVVAWHYNGGAGFDWYHKAEDADRAFVTEKANADEFADSDWEAYRFDVVIPQGEDETNYIDEQLDELCDKAAIKYKTVV